MEHKFFLFLIIYLFLVTGCSFIYRDQDSFKYYGVRQQEAEDTLERINQKEESQKKEIRWLSTEE